LNTKTDNTKIFKFLREYVKTKQGNITQQENEVIKVTFQNGKPPIIYTFQPDVSRKKKIPLIALGSPTFQEILRECLENGILSQIIVNPKPDIETYLKNRFAYSSSSCAGCEEVILGNKGIGICVKPQPCYHIINNGNITEIKNLNKKSVRFFQFYFLISFHNKLKPKSEEVITILIDEKSNIVKIGELNEDQIVKNNELEIDDVKGKIKPKVFDDLRKVADLKIEEIIKAKLLLFDLQLIKEKKAKLKNFDKRLRRERREQLISKKIDFNFQRWQTNYESLLRREEESYITNVKVKLVNLLIVNTIEVKFEANLSNNSRVHSSLTLGVNESVEINCPICKNTFSEGYATEDALYVCEKCIKQSVDTGKIYSKKATLTLDPVLKEYIEPEAGFVCSVCGKKYSKLLEYKCSYDNTSVCIHHYGFCDICGETFSKLNLSYTDEFKSQLCPKHATKNN